MGVRIAGILTYGWLAQVSRARQVARFRDNKPRQDQVRRTKSEDLTQREKRFAVEMST